MRSTQNTREGQCFSCTTTESSPSPFFALSLNLESLTMDKAPRLSMTPKDTKRSPTCVDIPSPPSETHSPLCMPSFSSQPEVDKVTHKTALRRSAQQSDGFVHIVKAGSQNTFLENSDNVHFDAVEEVTLPLPVHIMDNHSAHMESVKISGREDLFTNMQSPTILSGVDQTYCSYCGSPKRVVRGHSPLGNRSGKCREDPLHSCFQSEGFSEYNVISGAPLGPHFMSLDSMLKRSTLALPARSFYTTVWFLLIALIVLPFLLIVILFSVHYWAVSGVLSNHQDGSLDSFGNLKKDSIYNEDSHVDSRRREAVTFVTGIIVNFFIIVLLNGFILWFISWRYLFAPFGRFLKFICVAAFRLSRIEALTREEIDSAPKELKFPFSVCSRKYKNSVLPALIRKMIMFGVTLQVLKRYALSQECKGHFSSSIYADNRTTITTKQSDDPKTLMSPCCLRKRPEYTVVNSIHEKTIPISPILSSSQLEQNVGILTRRSACTTVNDPGEDVNNSSLRFKESIRSTDSAALRPISYQEAAQCSSRRIQLYPSDRNVQGVLNRSPSISSVSFLCAQATREKTGSEGIGMGTLTCSERHCVLQQVTFLVCRIFLPNMKLDVDDATAAEHVFRTWKMATLFIDTVLRIAKEGHGIAFDIRMDSVIVIFCTSPGPNSVNFVRPRNCAFRLVSELAKVESEWVERSSTPFRWGVSMHVGQLIVGLSGAVPRRLAVFYGEEVQLAYRVTELCQTLHCPLLILQPCYDVFRVCMAAVPVDVVIFEKANEEKTYMCLYEPKFVGDDVFGARQRYAPLGEAFGHMCEKMFDQAANKFETILDLDHNAFRLYKLCCFLDQQQRRGTMDEVLQSGSKYARGGPMWRFMEYETQKFFDHYQEQLDSAIKTSDPLTHLSDIFEQHKNLHDDDYNDMRPAYFSSFGGLQSCNGSMESQTTGCGQALSTSIPPVLSFCEQIALDVPESRAEAQNTVLYSEDIEMKEFSAQRTHLPRGASSQDSLVDTQRYNAYQSKDMVTPPPDFSEVQSEVPACLPHTSVSSKKGANLKKMGEGSESKLEFDIFEAIGKGSFSVIYRGLHPNGKLVAIKEYPITVEDEHNPLVKSVHSEVRMLAGCRHKNVVRYINSRFQNGLLYIITEFVSGGSLTALVQTFHTLPRDTIRRYTGDMLRGLRYLHERQIVHRDISPNNVLVSIDGVCKLNDFGGAVECAMQQATHMPERSSGRADDWRAVPSPRESPGLAGLAAPAGLPRNCFGTPVCMSPQACAGVVDPKNDIWSLGITLCFCFAGRYPWREDDMMDVVSFIGKVCRGEIVPEVPVHVMDTEAADFVHKCLSRDMHSRPSTSELMFHPFMVN